MTLAFYLSLLAVCLLGTISPGPSLFVVAKNTLASGRMNGLVSALAHSLGIAFYALFAISGLALVLQEQPLIFKSITYLAGCYLIYLGVKALRAKGGIVQTLNTGAQTSLLDSAREGLFISVLNPKVGLFFIALFSQFIDASQTLAERTILIATPVILDGLWFCFIALILSTPTMIGLIQQKAGIIDKLSGVIMLILAANILLF